MTSSKYYLLNCGCFLRKPFFFDLATLRLIFKRRHRVFLKRIIIIIIIQRRKKQHTKNEVASPQKTTSYNQSFLTLHHCNPDKQKSTVCTQAASDGTVMIRREASSGCVAVIVAVSFPWSHSSSYASTVALASIPESKWDMTALVPWPRFNWV